MDGDDLRSENSLEFVELSRIPSVKNLEIDLKSDDNNISITVEQNRDDGIIEAAGNPPPHTIFKHWQRLSIVTLSGCAGFFSALSILIYLPALPVLEAKFDVTNELINITVVIYTLFQGFSPTFWGPLSDRYGRRPVYLICFVLYIGSCTGLALAPSYTVILIMRAFQSISISCTVSLGSAVSADVSSRKDRGTYMAIAGGLALLGNAFGPLIGGALTISLGWRADFWFLVIISAVVLLILALFFPETNRNLVGNGSVDGPYFFNREPIKVLQNLELKDPTASVTHTRVRSLWLPYLLFRELDVIFILVPNGIHYTAWLMMITAQSSALSKIYDFNSLQTGLSYLANGVGSVCGSVLSGRIMNWYYKRRVAMYRRQCLETGIEMDMANFNIQKARLGTSIYLSIGLMSAVLIFGWTIEYHKHFIIPILATFVGSFCSLYYMNQVSTLLVDLFPLDSAAASSTVNVSRCTLGTVGIAVLDRMTSTLGTGKSFSIVAALCLMTWPLVYYELTNGQKIDRKRREKIMEREEEEQERIERAAEEQERERMVQREEMEIQDEVGESEKALKVKHTIG